MSSFYFATFGHVCACVFSALGVGRFALCRVGMDFRQFSRQYLKTVILANLGHFQQIKGYILTS